MSKINLQKIMAIADLSKKELAEALFPMNKYSNVALTRVLRGESALDENQIYRLSVMLGITIADLFENQEWKAEVRDGLHIFSRGLFKAVLDLDSMTTTVFNDQSLVTTVVMSSKNVTLTEYINFLNKLV